jgi:hypothetical protein
MVSLKVVIQLKVANKYGTLGLSFFKETPEGSKVQFGHERAQILEDIMNL